MTIPKQLSLRGFNLSVVLWVLLHLVVLRILIDHEDIIPTVAGRYSWSYAAALALMALVGVAGTVVLLRAQQWAPPRALEALRERNWFIVAVLTISTVLLLLVWTTPFQIFLSTVQKETMRGYATGGILAAAYVTLFWCSPDRVIPWSGWVAIAAVFGIAVLAITVHYLDRFPQLNQIDELHNWVVQWTYANTGLLGDTLYRQMIPLPQPIYDSPHYIFGLILRLIGDTFWQARFARLLMAVIALPFIYLCGKRMYGARAGLLAVVVALFLLVPTAYVRPDVFVGVMLSIALYVYLRAQTTHRPWMHYLTGLCIALAGEGHPLAYRFGLTFALLYGLRWLFEMRKERRLFIDGRVFALGLGGLTGMLIYLSIHIIPGFEQGLHFARNYTPATRTAGQQLSMAIGILYQQIEVWVRTSPFELLLVILGVGVAANELNDGDRVLLSLILVSEVLMVATYGYYREFYQVHFLPVFSLLAGRALASFLAPVPARQRAGSLRNLALVSVILVVSLATLVQNAASASNDTERAEFTAIARRLKADLPPNKIIVGNENYFIEFRSPNFYGIQTVTTDGWFMVNYQGYQLWEVTNPDVFILTSEMDTPKYTDMTSIYSYMDGHDFKLARCYTETGLINARVYVREMPTGWTPDVSCQPRHDDLSKESYSLTYPWRQ